MKMLYLLLNRFKQYFLRNKILFVLFVLGGAINTIAVIYSYGNLMPLVANRNLEDPAYRNYVVNFEAQPAQIERIEELRSNPLIESCIFSEDTNICAFDAAYPVVKLNGTLEFTSPYQVIAPQTANVIPGQEIKIGGKAFQVIGSASCGIGDVYFIPYDTYLELGYGTNIRKIRLYAVSRQDVQNDRVIALVNDIFPNHTGISSLADTMYQLESKESSQFLTVIVINAFLSAVAYAFLLYYILDSLHRENGILMILGESKARITVCILREAIILSALANGLGLLIHVQFYQVVFSGLNITSGLQYTPGDYFFIYLVMLILSLLTSIPFIIKGWTLSPVESRRLYL